MFGLRTQLADAIRERDETNAKIATLKQELNWQNHRNSGHPTAGGFEFYINEEWTGLANAALDADYGWHAALRKKRLDPDDERVRVRRAAEDDTILKERDALRADLANLKSYHAELSHKHLTDADRWRTDLAKVTAERDANLAAYRESYARSDAGKNDLAETIKALRAERDSLLRLDEAKEGAPPSPPPVMSKTLDNTGKGEGV